MNLFIWDIELKCQSLALRYSLQHKWRIRLIKKSKSLLLLLHMCPFQYFYVRFGGILSSFKAFLAEIHFSKEICIFWIIGNLLAMYRAFSCEFTGYFINKTHCTKRVICLEKLCSINLVMVKGNTVFFLFQIIII